MNAINSESEDGVTDFFIKNLLKIVEKVSQSLSEDKLTVRQSEDLQVIIKNKLENMHTNMYLANLTRFLADIKAMDGEFEGEFGKLTKPERIVAVVKEAKIYVERGWLDNDGLRIIERASKVS